METDGKGIELIQTSAKAEYHEAERGGILFSNKKMEPVLFDPQPSTLGVCTLTAIKDFLTANIDGLLLPSLALHVESERMVSLVSKIDGPNLRRRTYIVAKAEEPSFQFGQWMDPESFVIGLQTAFQSWGAREQVMALAGNIREGKERIFEDDGISQTVSAKVGVKLETVKLPSPVDLAPWRTFREIAQQPPSQFIMRARAGSEEQPPKLALFVTDGNRWRLDAIKLVAEWLRAAIADVTVLA